MSKTVVYPENISLPTSIIDMFNGTGTFIISNRFFPKESGYDETFHDLRVIKPSDKGGFRLGTPSVSWRNQDTKTFDRFFVVAWCDAKCQAKQYFITKPDPKYFSEDSFARQNVKVSITPNSKDERTRKAEEVLCALDHQLVIGMQVLLIANLFDIDFSKFSKDNSEFFEQLSEGIVKNADEKALKTKEIAFDPAFIDSFTNPPYYGKVNKITMTINKPHDDDEELEQSFKSAIDTVRESVQMSVLKKKAKNELWRTLTDRKDVPVPQFTHTIYKNKDEHYTEICSPRLKFVVSFNPKTDKIKRITGVQRATRVMPMTHTDLINAWGGNAVSNKGSHCEGVIFIVPELSYQYFAQGQPCTLWRVDRMSTRKTQSTRAEYDDGAEYFDNDGGDDINAPFKPSATTIDDENVSDDGYDAP